MVEVNKKVAEPKKNQEDSVLRYRMKGVTVKAESPDAAMTKIKKEHPELFAKEDPKETEDPKKD